MTLVDPLHLVSLFSGYGGLELGVARALDVELVAHAEIDPPANRVLAARFPGVPNLGDVSAIDWHAWAADHGRVDVLCGGFPCQDVSVAGYRRGLGVATRSGLWSEFARAIAELRPALVIVENVVGLLSATADRALGPEAEALDPGDLRALGAVLGDLAALGFDAEWITIRASDVGAPHRRSRVFLAAQGAAADAGRHEPERRRGPRPVDAAPPPAPRTRDLEHDAPRAGRDPAVDWGPYGTAVRRWERILGREAPAPTETVAGRPVLAPDFVEWMMGLPAGWITAAEYHDPNALPGSAGRRAATRAEQLRLLGNGVVPQQAEHALRLLLARR